MRLLFLIGKLDQKRILFFFSPKENLIAWVDFVNSNAETIKDQMYLDFKIKKQTQKVESLNYVKAVSLSCASIFHN